MFFKIKLLSSGQWQQEQQQRKHYFQNNEKNQDSIFFLIEESNYIQASRPTANAKFVFDAVLTGWNISSKQTEFKMEILTELWLYCYYYHVKSLLSS